MVDIVTESTHSCIHAIVKWIRCARSVRLIVAGRWLVALFLPSISVALAWASSPAFYGAPLIMSFELDSAINVDAEIPNRAQGTVKSIESLSTSGEGSVR